MIIIDLGTLTVDIAADTKKLDRGMRKAKRSVRSATQKIKTAAAGATAALAGIGVAGGYFIKAASDAQELQNVIQVSFGDMSDEINQWAKQTSDAMNRSDYAIQNFVGTSMSMIKSMVDSTDQAREMSKQITKLSVDLASFRNISDKRAFEAITGAITGESEALKRLGFNVQQAALEQYAMNQGIEKGVREMTEQEKVMLRYNLIMKKMQDIQGDAARTSDSFANQLKALKGEWRNIREEIGQYLLPTATNFLQKANEMLDSFDQLSESTKKSIIRFSGFTAAALGAVAALGGLVMASSVVVTGISAIASAIAFLANPVTAGIALAYTFYSAWEQNLWGVRDNLKQLWGSFQDWYNNVLDGNNDTVNYFVDNFMSGFQHIADALKWISNRFIDFHIIITNITEMVYESMTGSFDGIASFVGSVINWMADKFAWLFSQIMNIFGEMGKELSSQFKFAQKQLSKGIDAFDKKASQVQEDGGILGRVLEGTGKDHISNMADKLNNSLDNMVKTAEKKAPEIAGKIQKWSQKAKQGMGQLWDSMQQTANETFDKILKVIKNKAPELHEKIKEIIDAFNFEVDVNTNKGDTKSGGGDTTGGGTPDEKEQKSILRFWGDLGSKMDKVRKDFIKFKDQMITGLSDAIARGEDLNDVFDSFLDKLASSILQQMVIGPAVNSVMSFAGLPVAHQGGYVANGGIEKFHNGGVAGLKSNEVPAVLEEGETVLTEEQTESLGNKGSQQVTNININAVDAKSFQELAARNPEAITNVVNQDISKNGQTRKTIKQNI